MLTQIKFIITKTELEETLKFLAPFIVFQKKEDDEEDEGSEIILPEPYFYDKVTFLLYKTFARLSVLTKEGVRIEKTCHIDSNVEELSFCLPHAYLLQEVSKHETIGFTFKEDRFFGFNVFDSLSDKLLFDIDAYSVSKQPSIHPKFFDTLYPKTVGIRHEDLLKALDIFAKYTREDSLRPFCESIWFVIKDGICKVTATTGSSLRQESFQTKETRNYEFSIPGKFAHKFYDIINRRNDYTHNQIGYNKNYLCIFGAETIEVPVNKCELPNLDKTLSKRNINHRSSLKVENLKSAFKMMNTIDYKDDYVIMHFMNNHVNIHCQDTIDNHMVNVFYDTVECDGDYTIRLHQKTLEGILKEVYSDNVILTLVDDNLLYISNEDESLFEDIIRIQCTAKMREEDLKLLEKGDNSLMDHSVYIEKYLTVQEDPEDDCSSYELATSNEMKVEAIRRMREVIEYTDIIESFEETGLPQVYEPPYGASYSLEDDELENVRSIENSRNVLVWGVIRCNMMFNRQEVTVDCMLHVSCHKDEWEQEREDLRNGLPNVYTVMKEYPVTDHGNIQIYKSEGGTLLRK